MRFNPSVRVLFVLAVVLAALPAAALIAMIYLHCSNIVVPFIGW
jgi:hypothetical protein